MAGRAVQALTKRVCEAAQPLSDVGGKRSELILWDGTVKGFGLRVSAGGARSFILIYRAGRGRGAPSRKVTIGKYGSPLTVETARKEARRILGLVADGQDPAGEASEQRRAKAAGRAPKGSVGAAI